MEGVRVLFADPLTSFNATLIHQQSDVSVFV